MVFVFLYYSFFYILLINLGFLTFKINPTLAFSFPGHATFEYHSMTQVSFPPLKLRHQPFSSNTQNTQTFSPSLATPPFLKVKIPF